MSKFSIILLLFIVTQAKAQQVSLNNGLKMTVFNQTSHSKRASKTNRKIVLNDEQSLKMVVFNRGTSSGSHEKIVSTVSPVTVKKMPKVIDSIDTTPMKSRIKLSTGYRRDDLNFTIADPSGSPNVLSELDWHDLHSQQIGADFDLSFAGGLYIQALADIAWIWSGQGRDSDWKGDNKTQEFSRSVFDTEGYLFDLSAGIGYSVSLSSRNSLKPIVGYGLNEQHVNMRHGKQLIPNSGGFGGLDSDYEARWHGPWLGLRWDYIGSNFEFFVQGEYHWLDYRAEANWNLRSDFQHPISFVHKADADGWVAKIGGSYRITDTLSLSLDANYRDWKTGSGDDDTFFAGGIKGTTMLNSAKWLSYGANLGVSWGF